MRGAAQLVSAEEAVRRIPSGSTLAISGFVGAGHPEMLTSSLERCFLRDGRPRDLTFVYAAGQGDRKDRGLNHLAHPGLVKRVIGGHWNLAPQLGRMALENQIEAYNIPQGIMCTLMREIAAKRPGVFSKVGMNTFIDPIHTGGRMNQRTTERLVERVGLGGEEWLWYRSFPVQVGLIRGTYADRNGNITMEKEALIGEVLPIAQAAKNHGGIVIAQVEKVLENSEGMDPKSVRVPGILVDYVVISDPKNHEQTFAESFNKSYISRSDSNGAMPSLPFSERKIIGQRTLREIRRGDIVNLGIGLPETVAAVAEEEGKMNDFTLTVESGPIGGRPAGGLSFGCSAGPEAIMDQPSQFDYYDGGGLDVAVLGAVEVDEEGSVNVSNFCGRFAGVGGFMNIAHNTKRIIFCCTFRAGDLKVDWDGKALRILKEGQHCKFVKRVGQVCFHGPSAWAGGQEALYVTERAVLRLTPKGLELVEVAPGISVKDQILKQMEFKPLMVNPKAMPAECFSTSSCP